MTIFLKVYLVGPGRLDEKKKSEVKSKVEKVLQEWKLIESIKELNELVSAKDNKNNIMYGIDRIREYELKEKHKMIYRYFLRSCSFKYYFILYTILWWSSHEFRT